MDNNVLAQLQQLAGQVMSSPKGQAMAQAVLSQMGGGGADPRARFAGGQPNGPGGPSADMNASRIPMAMVPDPVGGPNPRTDAEISDFEGEQNMVRGNTPREPQMNMATGEMGPQEIPQNVPNTGGLNSDGPTPEEVKLLMSNPSARNIANFNKLFGPGAAEQVLGVGPHGPGETDYNDNQGHTTYEDDVRAAMRGHHPGESDYDDNQGHDD